jgi:hypothetical protein
MLDCSRLQAKERATNPPSPYHHIPTLRGVLRAYAGGLSARTTRIRPNLPSADSGFWGLAAELRGRKRAPLVVAGPLSPSPSLRGPR